MQILNLTPRCPTNPRSDRNDPESYSSYYSKTENFRVTSAAYICKRQWRIERMLQHVRSMIQTRRQDINRAENGMLLEMNVCMACGVSKRGGEWRLPLLHSAAGFTSSSRGWGMGRRRSAVSRPRLATDLPPRPALCARCVLWTPPVLAQGSRTSLSSTTRTPLGPYLGRIHSPPTLPLAIS